MKPLKDYTKDELIALVKYYNEKERYIAHLVGVADAGQYRADWDAPLLRIMKERDQAVAKLKELDESSPEARKKQADNETLRGLLTRAIPFLRTVNCTPLSRDIDRALSGDIPPGESVVVLRETLETILLHLWVWQSLNHEEVGQTEKSDTNKALSLLGKPKRFEGVPIKGD
jgi:hypothetical protein